VTFDPSQGERRPLDAWVRALELTAAIPHNPSVTLPVLIDQLAQRFSTAPALLSDTNCLTYRALADAARGYTRWALRQGLSRADVVCLLMPNCPSYMAIWLGITRIGAVVSLVNTNLTHEALAHSIRIAAPKMIIVGPESVPALNTALGLLNASLPCWAHGDGNHGLPRIDLELDADSADDLAQECRWPSIADPALYIYTSGTTGLPKAARVNHFRIMQWTHWFAGLMDIRPDDRMYNCLPMYHSIGGIVATGAPLVAGGSVVIRERFSAGRFWDEVCDWDCTLFQYIGELCRYLVKSPPHRREKQHRLRLCCGNGLSREIWDLFERRFLVPQVLEYYAATEATFSLYNCEGERGAIGRIPGFLAHRIAVAILKIDLETGEPRRGDDGLCIRCSANEVGEAIGKVAEDGSTLAGRFEGYTDDAASAGKILRNVFALGDSWYRTGDLMRRDERGYFYFVDRLGDTFRWKGENVSTTEIAELISACPGVLEAAVYGVRVPATEGRAGMAAITVALNFDLAQLHRHIAERIPEYGRPLFLRIRAALDTTATFRPKKQELLREGYDPSVVSDALYLDDREHNAYRQIGAELYARIQSGEIRL
jgi:fatty-acyl-CoA synthase